MRPLELFAQPRFSFLPSSPPPPPSLSSQATPSHSCHISLHLTSHAIFIFLHLPQGSLTCSPHFFACDDSTLCTQSPTRHLECSPRLTRLSTKRTLVLDPVPSTLVNNPFDCYLDLVYQSVDSQLKATSHHSQYLRHNRLIPLPAFTKVTCQPQTPSKWHPNWTSLSRRSSPVAKPVPVAVVVAAPLPEREMPRPLGESRRTPLPLPEAPVVSTVLLFKRVSEETPRSS